MRILIPKSCFGQTVHYETSTLIGNNPDYTWAVYGGDKIGGGGHDQNFVDVTWNTLGEGLVQVYIDVSEGSGICDAIENNHVTVNPTPSPVFNSWSSTVCPNQSVTYSLTQTYSSHSWSTSGGTVLSGGGSQDPSVTVRWGNSETGTVSVTVENTVHCSATTGPITINITDTQPPTITCPPRVTVNANANQCFATSVTLGNPTTSDNCGNLASVTNDAPVQFPVGETTVIWTAIDYKGLTATCSHIVEVIDNQNPTANNPPPITLTGCNGTFPAPDPLVVTDEADNCGPPNVAFVSDGTPSLVGCTETTVRRYSVTDEHGNSINVYQNLIRTFDITPPIINVPAAALAMQCFDAALVTTWAATASALDACSGTAVVTSSYTAPTGNCNQTVTVTFSATDACGNTGTTTRVFTVNDNTAPTITGTILTTTLEGCSATAVPAAVTNVGDLEGLQLAISDNCTPDASLIVTSSDVSSGNCPIVVTRTYRVTDACGNFREATQVFNVDDNTAPSIMGTLAAIVVEGCNAAARPPATNTLEYLNGAGLTITDACGDAGLTVTSSDGTPSGSCPITIIRTYTITDACENQSAAQQTISINAAVLVFLAPSPHVVPACSTQDQVNQAFGQWISNTWGTVSGGCHTSLEHNAGAAPNNCGGSVEVQFTANSDCQTIIHSATFTVAQASDLIVSCPNNIILPACTSIADIQAAYTAWRSGFTVSGGCSPITNLSSIPALPAGIACGGSFSFVFTADNGSGLCIDHAECTSTFTVVDAPDLVFPAPNTNYEVGACLDQNQVAQEYNGWINNIRSTISGGCNTQFTHNSPGAPDRCGGSRLVEFRAISDCETITHSATFSVINDTPPTILCPISGVQGVDANSGTNYIHSGTGWDATGTDNCSPPVLTYVLTGATTTNGATTLNGINFREGVTTVTWTATDNCGNIATCQFTVTVYAAADLEITKTSNPDPAVAGQNLTYNITVINHGPGSARNVIITDLVSAFTSPAFSTDNITYSPWTGSYNLPGNLPAGSNTIIYIRGALNASQCSDVSNTASVTNTVRDDNQANNSITITTDVVDQTNPVMICPGPLIAVCDISERPAYSTYAQFVAAGGSVTDNCGINEASFNRLSEVSDGHSCPEIVTRTYQIADLSGNINTCSQTINVDDQTLPAITGCPPAQTFCDVPSHTFTIPSLTGVSDNCGGILTVSYEVTGATTRIGVGYDASGIFNTGNSTIIWTVEDACLNRYTCVTNVTVNPLPTVTVNSPTVCEGTAATITATPGTAGTYNYAWIVPVGVTNPGSVASFTSTVAGTYSVVITSTTTNCTSASANGTVTVNPLPTVTLNSPTVCEGTAATITATPSTAGTYNYAWTVPAGVTNPGSVASFTSTVAGTYSVVITNTTTNCASASANGTVTVNPLPTVTVNSPTVCEGTAATITATPGTAGTYNYAWIVPVGVTNPGSVASFTSTVAGTYSVVITSTTTNCTSASANGTVTVNPLPTVTLNSPTVCEGTAATITATPSTAGTYNYAWTVPAGVTNPGSVASFTSTVAGTYSVVITNTTTNCASASANGTVTVNPLLVTTGAIICQGESGVLTSTTNCQSESPVTTPARFAGQGTGWGVSSGNITANDNNNATYSIGRNNNSPSLNATNFGFNIPLNATISGIQVTIGRYAIISNAIRDNSVRLIVGGAVIGANAANTTLFWPTTEAPANYGSTTYLWGLTLSPSQVNAINFGVALIAQNTTGTNNISARVDYIQISITYTLPGLNWYTLPTGGSPIFYGSPFNPVGVAGSGLSNTNTSGTTTYWAACSSTPDCRTATDFVINSRPVPTITGPASVCLNSTTTYITEGGMTGYSWTVSAGGTITGGAGTNSINVNWTTTGNKTITVNYTAANGCIAAAPTTYSVIVYANPTATISGTTSFCEGTSTVLSAAGSTPGSGTITGYQWYLDSSPIIGATSQTYTATTAGNYTVTVTNSNNCSTTSAAVNVTTIPRPAATFEPDPSVCRGIMSASLPYTSLTGNPNQYSIDYSPEANAEGFQDYNNIVLPASPISLTIPSGVAAGIYTASITLRNSVTGCLSIGYQVTVTVRQNPQGTVTSSTAVCPGENGGTLNLLDYTGNIIQWESSVDGGNNFTTVNPLNTSASLDYLNLTQTTVYRVYLELNGCYGYSSYGIVPVDPFPILTVSADASEICEDASIQIVASSNYVSTNPFPINDFTGNPHLPGWTGAHDASNNNEDTNSDWGVVNDNDGRIFNGITYISNAPLLGPGVDRFIIAMGETEEPDNETILVTPPYSLIGILTLFFIIGLLIILHNLAHLVSLKLLLMVVRTGLL